MHLLFASNNCCLGSYFFDFLHFTIGLGQGLSEELIQKTFSSYGIIQEIRVFKDKGYAFVRFATKESATHAIVAVHNTEVNGQIVKCSWGKESSDPNNQQVQQHVSTLLGAGCYLRQLSKFTSLREAHRLP